MTSSVAFHSFCHGDKNTWYNHTHKHAWYWAVYSIVHVVQTDQAEFIIKAQTDQARQHPDMLRRYQTQVLTGSSSECLKVSKGQRLVAEFRNGIDPDGSILLLDPCFAVYFTFAWILISRFRFNDLTTILIQYYHAICMLRQLQLTVSNTNQGKITVTHNLFNIHMVCEYCIKDRDTGGFTSQFWGCAEL